MSRYCLRSALVKNKRICECTREQHEHYIRYGPPGRRSQGKSASYGRNAPGWPQAAIVEKHRLWKDSAEFSNIGENLLTLLRSSVGLKLVSWCLY